MNHIISHEEHGQGGIFFIERDGMRIAELTYQRIGVARVVIDHTHVDTSLRGQGIARQLLDAAIAWARQTSTKVSATCSYVTVQFARDPSLCDVADSQ
jgi:uncharacterized protein